MLTWQYSPKTRQRSLALSQAIGSFPCFSESKPLSEPIAALEQLVREYEMVNNKVFDREILLGVLIRCSPTHLRQHLTLSMNSTTTYEQAREIILGFERSSRTWDMSNMIRDVQTSFSSQSGTSGNQGPAPMEVDSVTKGWKGKEKNKGKSKGKGYGSWGSWASGAFQKGFGYGGKSKGKDKGKQKGKNYKGKS